ncbi:MAG: Methionine synthase [Bacteroidetes bacterium ADurb.Bin174]|nr:MAG: Methionine synthase [Bacteroidetes bacterium ADurb.Bin174]
MQKVPNTLGLIELRDIPLREIIPYIHWSYLFMAWRIPGKYEGITKAALSPEEERNWLKNLPAENKAKAEEALKLYKDAWDMLKELENQQALQINANVGFYQAYTEGDDIIIDSGNEKIYIPTLRQQKASPEGYCYALADFINLAGDYIGVFANTVLGVEAFAKKYENEGGDVYKDLLVRMLADRLAEGTAEWLHYKIRTQYWGYAPDEPEDINEMFKVHYQGIRPAVGYPSLPDQSVIFDLDPLIQFNEMGIRLTEHGAMSPNASVCGLIFSHPQSKYFVVGKIDEEQLLDYARRRNKSPEEMRKWLSANL